MEFFDKYHDFISKGLEKYKFIQSPQELYSPINYILSHGGKRIRPIMVLMANDLFGGDKEKALKPALAIEFFHNFTLIHDDIMDEAPLRRGNPTIHAMHGISTGVLCGDALMIKAYQFFEDLEPKLFKKNLQIFSDTGSKLCEGQQMDINFETEDNVTYEDYLRMISYKTGVLSAASLKIGALIGGASEKEAEDLYQFGLHLGIAFQMMDDYLDVFGDQEQVGKKHAGDIFENKKTILYLTARQFANKEELDELDFWYSKKIDNIDKVYSVEKIFRKTKADEKVQKLILHHSEEAQLYLDKIEISKEKKEPLIELKNFLLNRNY